jgi:hypothetical protein
VVEAERAKPEEQAQNDRLVAELAAEVRFLVLFFLFF